MTTVVAEPGICSEQTTIVVDKTNKRKVKVTIGSGCEMVIKLVELLTEVNQWDTVRQHLDFQVLKTVSRFQVHATYPIPTTIRKITKVEGSLVLPRDVLPRLEVVKLQLSPIGMYPEESR